MESLTKRRTYEILETAKEGDIVSRVVDTCIMTLIGLNVLLVVVESIEGIQEQYGIYFAGFEAFSVVIFTVEYLLRIWSCTENPKYSDPIRGRLRYAVSAMAIIDLLAIIPFYVSYLPLVFAADISDARILRVFRMFRLLKLTRYFSSLQMILRIVNRAREELLIAFVFIAAVVMVVSTIMFFVEHDAQQEAGIDQFTSIPMSMYWGAVTVSTVGYGDAVPITPLGRFLAGIISIFGIGMFAMPTAILSYEFMKEVQGRRRMDSYCPHCGELIEHPRTRSTDAPDRRADS